MYDDISFIRGKNIFLSYYKVNLHLQQISSKKKKKGRKKGRVIRWIIGDVSPELSGKRVRKGRKIFWRSRRGDKEQVSSDLFPGKNFITASVSI